MLHNFTRKAERNQMVCLAAVLKCGSDMYLLNIVRYGQG